MLSQNTTQANTKVTRANLCRPGSRLAPDTPVILRVEENVFIKLHRCQESLTAMRMTTVTREQIPVLYVTAHRLIAFKASPSIFN